MLLAVRRHGIHEQGEETGVEVPILLGCSPHVAGALTLVADPLPQAANGLGVSATRHGPGGKRVGRVGPGAARAALGGGGGGDEARSGDETRLRPGVLR